MVSSDDLLEIIEIIQSDALLSKRRLLVGQRLLHLFHAHTFVSYVSGPDGPFSDPVAVNLGEASLNAYDEHFRNVDIVTPKLFRQRGATRISPPRDSKEEFIRDFLHRQSMYHGMNFFARSPALGKVDLRIWRDSTDGAFTEDDVRLLEGIGGLIERIWSASPSTCTIHLTPREKQVAEMVSTGMSDKQICARLQFSMSTLRTHLRHVYDKVGAQNRAGLAVYYVQHHH